MDEIETGFQNLVERIGENGKERESLKEEVKKQEVALFGRMITLAAPLVKDIGITHASPWKTGYKGGAV